MQGLRRIIVLAILSGLPFTGASSGQELALIAACGKMIADGLRPVATARNKRFQGKVEDFRARCRGGDKAVLFMRTPWVDWPNYWATGDTTSKSSNLDTRLSILRRDRNRRGVTFALEDLEYQRMELIKFNLFDNKTFQQYATGRLIGGKLVAGPPLKTWKEMRLSPDHPSFPALDVKNDGEQTCRGQLIRFRTLTGICNDLQNPAMGSTGQLFARNVQFEATFPDLEKSRLTANRHGGRLSLL